MSKLTNVNVRHICNSDDGLMSLYAHEELYHKGRKPLIFIRGHIGRYTINTKRILDNVPSNFKLIRNYENFWYDENIHLPYIADFAFKENELVKRGMYDFEDITFKKLANSVINMLEKAHLNDVDIVSASMGGTIGLLCSSSAIIDRVSTVSPTLPYSYISAISDVDLIKYKSIIPTIMFLISKIYLDHRYGFVKDLNETYKNPEFVKQIIDSSKCFIEAGNVEKITSHNITDILKELIMIIAAKSIKKQTGYQSDGAIITDPDFYQKIGVQYEIASDDYHLFCDKKEYLLKRAYDNLNKIKH